MLPRSALLFLLDKNQPDSGLERDWGFTIAVPAGAYHRFLWNVAFKLSVKPPDNSILREG